MKILNEETMGKEHKDAYDEGFDDGKYYYD